MASLFQRLFSAEEVEERPAPAQEAGATATPEPESGGLIPATKLPPAGDALTQLFAEEPAAEEARAEETQAEEAVTPEQVWEPPVTVAVTEVAPKRRGIFARLFAVKRLPKINTEEQFPNEQASTEENPAAQAQTESAGADVAEQETVSEEASADLALPIETTEAPIPAEELPSAADVLEQLFDSEPISAEPISTEAISAEPASADPAQPPSEEPTEVSIEAAIEENLDAGNDVRNNVQEDAEAEESPAESANETSVETLAVTEDNEESSHEAAETLAAEAENQDFATKEPEEIQEVEQAEAETTLPAAEPAPPRRLYREWAFDEKLASHREWVETHGVSGQRADLSGAELEATELISVNLRLADLHDANLRASDLLLADLRDACMVRADLEDACLVGANLEGANLEGASLETAMGLVPRQFAGANLRDALLAPHLMEFEAMPAFERASQSAFHYFAAMTAASVLSWLVIWKTADVQLLTDSAVIPFLHSRAAATALPTAESYLIVPVALFILYLVFHFHLQHLWDAVGELPAIFPDGHTLGDRGPGIIVGLLRTHFRWMNPDPSSTRLVEKGVCRLTAYWVVPATLLLFWVRYLTRQDLHGTILQVLLVVIATGIAFYATTKVGRPQEKWALEKKWTHRLLEKLKAGNPISIAAGLAAVLLFLSVGTIVGVPHDKGRAPQYGAASIRRWAPDVFWSLDIDPYADLTEGSISRKPANWTGGDDQVASVDGLKLNNAKFRYAQAYGAFFANARLWHADFQGAFLSDADMRGADLGESNLRFAVMDHAQMAHANLDRSNLEGADLRRADLREANLSYCSLEDAILVDARLDGANLYTARLMSATLTRANLEKADLRESFLNGAHMDHADLRAAYLWSAKLLGTDLGGAQLGNAILIGADLQGANLGGAQLSGTVLNDADLRSTSLEGANLRGALGLTANQVCSAKSRGGALLDDALEAQVEAQCGIAK